MSDPTYPVELDFLKGMRPAQEWPLGQEPAALNGMNTAVAVAAALDALALCDGTVAAGVAARIRERLKPASIVNYSGYEQAYLLLTADGRPACEIGEAILDRGFNSLLLPLRPPEGWADLQARLDAVLPGVPELGWWLGLADATENMLCGGGFAEPPAIGGGLIYGHFEGQLPSDALILYTTDTGNALWIARTGGPVMISDHEYGGSNSERFATLADFFRYWEAEVDGGWFPSPNAL